MMLMLLSMLICGRMMIWKNLVVLEVVGEVEVHEILLDGY